MRADTAGPSGPLLSARASQFFPESVKALDQFPPLLLELVAAGARPAQLEREGFTHFEASAVRTLLERVGYSTTRAGGQTARPDSAQAAAG